MATTIQGNTGSKTMTCTLNYITSGGQWAYRSGSIADSETFYVTLPSGYNSVASCKLYCTAAVTDDYGRFGSLSKSATVFIANSSAITGSELTNSDGSTTCPTNGTEFALSSTALSTINSNKPAQLAIRVGVTSSGSDYTPSTTINQTSGQTTSVQGKATLTVSSFYIIIETDNGGVVYYHDGTEWKKCEAYYHNGTSWVPCEAYRHDGTNWKKCGVS